MRAKDYTNQRHGRLTAVRVVRPGPRGNVWLFRCDCGEEVERIAQRVFAADSRIQSCGCLDRAAKSKPKFRDENGQFAARRRVYRMGRLVK